MNQLASTSIMKPYQNETIWKQKMGLRSLCEIRRLLHEVWLFNCLNIADQKRSYLVIPTPTQLWKRPIFHPTLYL